MARLDEPLHHREPAIKKPAERLNLTPQELLEKKRHLWSIRNSYWHRDEICPQEIEYELAQVIAEENNNNNKYEKDSQEA